MSALGIVLLVALFMWQGEQFLNSEIPVGRESIDAVVVLAGGPVEDKLRMKEAVKQFRALRADYLILPVRHPGILWSWFLKNYRFQNEIDARSVVIGHKDPSEKELWDQLGGTFLEATKTVKFMLDHGLKTAVVVSSPYHLRRARLAFQKVSDGLTLEFFYHSAPRSTKDDTVWWFDAGYVLRVVLEYGKLGAAILFY